MEEGRRPGDAVLLRGVVQEGAHAEQIITKFAHLLGPEAHLAVQEMAEESLEEVTHGLEVVRAARRELHAVSRKRLKVQGLLEDRLRLEPRKHRIVLQALDLGGRYEVALERGGGVVGVLANGVVVLGDIRHGGGG